MMKVPYKGVFYDVQNPLGYDVTAEEIVLALYTGKSEFVDGDERYQIFKSQDKKKIELFIAHHFELSTGSLVGGYITVQRAEELNVDEERIQEITDELERGKHGMIDSEKSFVLMKVQDVEWLLENAGYRFRNVK